MAVRLVTLYTRTGCHLCADMKVVIEEVAKEYPLELREVDIDADEALRAEYGAEVPVLAIDGRKAFKYRVTARDLLRRLRRA